MRTRYFTIFTMYAKMFEQFTAAKRVTLSWTLRKGPILNAGLSENFLILKNLKEDHNERDFKL